MIASWILLLYVAFLLYYPFNPVEISSYKVDDSIVTQGGILHYEISYCKYMDTVY